MDLPLAIEVQDSIYIDVPGEIERQTTDSPEIYREANSTMIENGGFNYRGIENTPPLKSENRRSVWGVYCFEISISGKVEGGFIVLKNLQKKGRGFY